MQLPEVLAEAQEQARDMLIEQYDQEHHIPKTNSTHPDLWPVDRWSEAYISIGEPDIAKEVFDKTVSAIRPDGGIPHLVQGSHKIAGVPAGGIDRLVYRAEGSGVTKLENGEKVTRLFAPPTLALSALALYKAGIELSKGTLDTLVTTQESLYRDRAMDNGLIAAMHRNELTNNASVLSSRLKQEKRVFDPAINALAVLNGRAIMELAWWNNARQDLSHIGQMRDNTEGAIRPILGGDYDNRLGPVRTPEQTLAVARLGLGSLLLRSEDLYTLYFPPKPDDKHPERRNLSMAECLEVARLTPELLGSQKYLSRVLPKLAAGGMTRFEGMMPDKSVATNKLRRREFWLPVAAQVVQIRPSEI